MVKLQKWGVKQLNTTDGKRYIITFKGKVSLSNRTYYKTKTAANKKVVSLNKREEREQRFFKSVGLK